MATYTNNAQLPISLAQELVDIIDIPICVFGEDMSVIWHNRSSRRLTAGRSNPFESPALQKKLQKAVGAVRHWRGDKMHLVRSGVRSKKLQLFRIVQGDQVFVIALLANKHTAKSDDATQRLSGYGLTRMECAIVEQLLHGHTPAEIAKTNMVTLETVRTHIKHAYSKMDVHCREKLFAKISAA
jgi:DNA-binding CsgD family transcriptional regulator